MLIKTTCKDSLVNRESIFDTATGINYLLQIGWNFAQTLDEAERDGATFDRVCISSISDPSSSYGLTIDGDEAKSFWAQLNGNAPAPTVAPDIARVVSVAVSARNTIEDSPEEYAELSALWKLVDALTPASRVALEVASREATK